MARAPPPRSVDTHRLPINIHPLTHRSREGAFFCVLRPFLGTGGVGQQRRHGDRRLPSRPGEPAGAGLTGRLRSLGRGREPLRRTASGASWQDAPRHPRRHRRRRRHHLPTEPPPGPGSSGVLLVLLIGMCHLVRSHWAFLPALTSRVLCPPHPSRISSSFPRPPIPHPHPSPPQPPPTFPTTHPQYHPKSAEAERETNINSTWPRDAPTAE